MERGQEDKKKRYFRESDKSRQCHTLHSVGEYRSDGGGRYLVAGQRCSALVEHVWGVSSVLDGKDSGVRTEMDEPEQS